jgi:hypothetical protein
LFPLSGGQGGAGGKSDHIGGDGGLARGARIGDTLSSIDPSAIQVYHDLEVKEFCQKFKLDDNVLTLLTKAQIRNAKSLLELGTEDVKEIGLGVGQRSELKRAMREWCTCEITKDLTCDY